jgi:AraC-like DNA-binding protein
MAKGTIAMCFVEQAIRPVQARGIDTIGILRAAGIAPQLLALPQARVSASSYSTLWRLVARALDDEFFGQDTHPMRVGSFAMLCHSVVSCQTLEHALRRASRFFGLVLDDLVVTLEAGTCANPLATLRLTQRRPGAAVRVFGHETMLILLHGLSCWLVGRRVPVLQACFAYAEPSYSAEYKMMYSERLSFDTPATQIEFESRYLSLPVIQTPETLKAFLASAPENIVLKYKNERSLTAQVRRQLRILPPAEWPRFEEIAATLHLTGSTLRRRLADEGQSYQLVLDELRRDLAIGALIHTTKTVSMIAAELGFADPGSFHRAFKKWTGTPPAGYRKTRAGRIANAQQKGAAR